MKVTISLLTIMALTGLAKADISKVPSAHCIFSEGEKSEILELNESLLSKEEHGFYRFRKELGNIKLIITLSNELKINTIMANVKLDDEGKETLINSGSANQLTMDLRDSKGHRYGFSCVMMNK